MLVSERKRGWPDAFGAVRLALSPTRLLVGVIGLLVLRLFWMLYPRQLEAGFACLLVNVGWMGASLWWLYVVLAGLGRSIYLELDEGEGPGLAETLRFTVSRGLSAGLSSMIFAVCGLALMALATLGFLFGRIPGVGTYLGALLYFPVFIFVALGALALILAVFGLYVVPGAAGVRKAGGLDTFLDTLDLFSGRGVFWGFLVTLLGVGVVSVILGYFYVLANLALSIGGGLEPPELATGWQGNVFYLMDLFVKNPKASLASVGAGRQEPLWVLVFECYRLICSSYLAGIFAASGVVAYIVGTEDEIVVVEEKRMEAPLPAPAVPPKEPAEAPAVNAKAAEPKEEAPAEEAEGETDEDTGARKRARNPGRPRKKTGAGEDSE